MYLIEMSDQRWAGPQIAKFMEIYKTHRILWDPSHPGYCRREDREAAMSQMLLELEAVGMPTTMELMKKRMKSYRDTYRNELTRMIKKLQVGKVHNPKLAWFPVADSFLRIAILGKAEAANMEESLAARTRTLNTVYVSSKGYVTVDTTTERDPLALDVQPENVKEEQLDSPPVKKIKTEPLDPLPEARQTEQSCRTNLPKEVTKAEEDVPEIILPSRSWGSDQKEPNETFGKHVAAQLNQLPPERSILLQEKIQCLITAERLRLIQASNKPGLNTLHTLEPDVQVPSSSSTPMETEDIVPSASAVVLTVPNTRPAPKTNAQRQSEYKKRQAASRTPAQARAFAEAKAEKQRARYAKRQFLKP